MHSIAKTFRVALFTCLLLTAGDEQATFAAARPSGSRFSDVIGTERHGRVESRSPRTVRVGLPGQERTTPLGGRRRPRWVAE